MDPGSQFVYNTFSRAQQILQLKSETERFQGMCSLSKSNMAYSSIGYAWLGDFNKLAREKNAVQQFYQLVPSIILNKAFGSSGNGDFSGSWSVNPRTVDRGRGYYAVSISVTTEAGKTYNAKAKLVVVNGKYKLIDAEYLGFSAVNYMARDFQKQLKQEYNKDPNRSMPVSTLIANITSQSGFMRCP
jgi:hypothetical protein